ncbi:hypothetical protein EG329_006937 [Mollisiaceae sp. DMI_Dod_QoI]|nr:hypothetical protein EG329_006937 [Helotiales sp. DMI_Dod_QoI]
MWTMKACLLIFYGRLTARTKDLLAVKLAAGLLAVTWVACFLTYFLECRPIWLYWQVLPGLPECAKAVGSVVVFGTTNLLTDLVVMIIPLPLIFRAQLPLKTKIQISAVFLIWIFAIAITTLKVVIILKNLSGSRKMIWTQAGLCSSSMAQTVAANTPIIHGLWGHGLLHVKKGMFRKDTCAPTPDYDLTVRAPTEEPDHELRDEPRSSRGSLGLRVSGGIRKSVRKISEKMRKSFDGMQIEQSISILQETKTGRVEHSNEADPADAFMGFGPIRSVGTVNTEIFSDSSDPTPRRGRTRFQKISLAASATKRS